MNTSRVIIETVTYRSSAVEELIPKDEVGYFSMSDRLSFSNFELEPLYPNHGRIL